MYPSLHNCPTDSSECLKLGSTSASEASWETCGRCKLYHALADVVMIGYHNLGSIGCIWGVLLGISVPTSEIVVASASIYNSSEWGWGSTLLWRSALYKIGST